MIRTILAKRRLAKKLSDFKYELTYSHRLPVQEVRICNFSLEKTPRCSIANNLQLTRADAHHGAKLYFCFCETKVSYISIPQINQPPGSAFSRHGPVQRTSITNVLVSKPKRNSPSLSEFLEIEDNDLNGPYDGQRPFVTGHNR